MSEGRAASPAVRLFLAFLSARLGFGLAFLVSAARRTPVPWYLPVEHRFVFASRPEGLGMDWYGRTALGLLVALVAGVGAYVLARRGRVGAWLGRRSVVMAVARAGGLVLLVDFLYFGWVLMHQTAAPWPLPAWYCAR
jgi:hypothetical protein